MIFKNLFGKSKDKKKNNDEVLQSVQTYQKMLQNDVNLMCSIIYQEENYSSHVLTWNNTLVIFEAPMKGTDDVFLPIDVPLKGYFVTKATRYETTFVLSKSQRNEKGQLTYVGEITAPLVKVQQRQAYRLEVILDVNYDLLDLESPDFAVLCSGVATCLNVSAGGMCLVNDFAFEAGSQLQVAFRLDNTNFVFIAEVLRPGKLNNSGTYTHGLKFVNPDKTDIEILSQLIFERQRAQRRQR